MQKILQAGTLRAEQAPIGKARSISTHQCTVPVMLPRQGAESDLRVQHLPQEVSPTSPDHSSGEVMARPPSLPCHRVNLALGWSRQQRTTEQWVLPSKVSWNSCLCHSAISLSDSPLKQPVRGSLGLNSRLHICHILSDKGTKSLCASLTGYSFPLPPTDIHSQETHFREHKMGPKVPPWPSTGQSGCFCFSM